MDMIPLSIFIPELVSQHNYYSIMGITKNNEVYELSSGDISEFYNNIFIEKLLINQFNVITIKTTYKFYYLSGSNEKINNNSYSELILLSHKNKVYVKNAHIVLIYKNLNLERELSTISSRFPNTHVEFTCLEHEFELINSCNRRKPIKIELSNYSHHVFTPSNTSKQKCIVSDFEKYEFNKAGTFMMSYEYSFFNKKILQHEKIKLHCSDIKKELKSLLKYVSEINNTMTGTLADRSVIRLMNKLCKKNPIQLKFDKEENDKFDFTSILRIGRFLEKEYKKENTNLYNFWELIRSVLHPSSNKTREYYNEIRQLFTAISLFSTIEQQIDTGDDKIILVFDTKLYNDLKLLHLIYNEELEIKLEKILLTTRD